MFKFKINEPIKICESDIPKPESLFCYENERYYILRGYVGGEEICGYYNKADRFLIGLHMTFEEDVAQILDDTKLIHVDENNFIVRLMSADVKLEDFSMSIKDRMESHLLGIIDDRSYQGKLILLENLLKDFDSKLLNYPDWMMQPTKVLSFAFLREEKPYSYDYVELDKLVGTRHPNYEGENWVDAFLCLKRPQRIIQAVLNPEYYEDLKNPYNSDKGIEYIKVDDEYFISSGNHRSIIAKIMGVKKLYAPVSYYKTDSIYKKLYNWFISHNFIVQFPNEVDYRAYDEVLDRNLINSNKSRLGLKYDWEIFIIRVAGKSIVLYGFHKINRFCELYESIRTEKLFIWLWKLNKRLMPVVNVLKLLIGKAHDTSTNDIVDAYFRVNFELLLNHKLYNTTNCKEAQA